MEASKAPAISRAVAVLRFLGKADLPCGVHTVARELGLVPSTCLHVLRTLVAEGLVSFDRDTKRYALDAGILTLARHWLRRNRFTDMAQPLLDDLGQTYDVTALGVRTSGLDHMVVVALSQTGPTLQLSTHIGSRFPALISASGRCVAAFGDFAEADLLARFATLQWDNAPTVEQWLEQVEQTRRLGFAVDHGQYIAGASVMATPVWETDGTFRHALVTIAIGGALHRTDTDALSASLLTAAKTISRRLNGLSADEEGPVGKIRKAG